MHQDATWYGRRPQPRELCVRWGPSLLAKRRWSPGAEAGGAPQFSAHVYFGQTAGCIKMSLGMELVLSPGDFVLDGDQPKRGRAPPNFWSTSIVAAWIKMPLGTEVGLGLRK